MEAFTTTLVHHGITKESLGITLHGLHTGYALRMSQEGGYTPPVRGGHGNENLTARERNPIRRRVRTEMSHGWVAATALYVGAADSNANRAESDSSQEPSVVAHVLDINKLRETWQIIWRKPRSNV